SLVRYFRCWDRTLRRCQVSLRIGSLGTGADFGRVAGFVGAESRVVGIRAGVWPRLSRLAQDVAVRAATPTRMKTARFILHLEMNHIRGSDRAWHGGHSRTRGRNP